MLADRNVLPNAVALHSTALNTARFIGPALGGLMIAWFNEAAGFMLHPILLMATLYQLLRIETVPRDVQKPEGSFVSCAGAGAMVAAMSLAARRGSDYLSRIVLAGNLSAVMGLATFSTTNWMPLAILGMFFVGCGACLGRPGLDGLAHAGLSERDSSRPY